MIRQLIASLFLVTITWNGILCDKTVKLVLDQGVLSGTVETSFLEQKAYHAFRGIPYAEPPVGELRFLVSEIIVFTFVIYQITASILKFLICFLLLAVAFIFILYSL